LAASVTGLALALGVPLAALLAKTDVGGRQAAFLVHAFPMFLPPFLLALGWFHLLGRRGLLGTEATSRLLFSFAGVVLVLALAFTPVGMSLGLLGFERWLAARRSFPVLGLRQRGTVPLPLGPWKGPAGAIVWALAAFSALPIAGLALRASAGGFAGVPAWIGASLTNSI